MTNQKLTFSLTFPLLSELLCFMKLLQEFAFPWKLFVNQQYFLSRNAILQRYLTPPFPVWTFRQWNTPTLPYDSVIATISSDILITPKKSLPMSHPQNSLTITSLSQPKTLRPATQQQQQQQKQNGISSGPCVIDFQLWIGNQYKY